MDIVTLHLILQITMVVLWGYTIFNTIKFRKSIPVNLFGTILTAEVLVIYIITTNLSLFSFMSDNIVWNRYEWYAFDFIVPIIINQILFIGNKLNKYLNWFAKSKNI